MLRLHLLPHRSHRCLRGHLWIYRSDLAPGQDLPDGEPVLVEHPRLGVIGSGFASAHSQICVRLMARGEVVLDDNFLYERLRTAIAARRDAPPCHRLIWSEGDLLPGLIVDRYHDSLVIQTTTSGMAQRQDRIVAWLQRTLSPTRIIERNDLAVRAHENLAQRAGILHGPDAVISARIGALTWDIDLLDPHKTGAYLDQQYAHQAVAARLSPGQRLADVCCHLGGFGLHAAQRGAHAVCIDQAEAGLERARYAAARAGLADRVETVAADAFAWLRRAAHQGERFDTVVLDPPSFAKNRDAVPAALRGYTDLHRHALALLHRGGQLATFTCSHHIDEHAFRTAILDSASTAKRTLRFDGRFDQPADHPILAAIPETEYLRGLRFTVVDVG